MSPAPFDKLNELAKDFDTEPYYWPEENLKHNTDYTWENYPLPERIPNEGAFVLDIPHDVLVADPQMISQWVAHYKHAHGVTGTFVTEGLKVTFLRKRCKRCKTEFSPQWWKCCPEHISEFSDDVMCMICRTYLHLDEIINKILLAKAEEDGKIHYVNKMVELRGPMAETYLAEQEGMRRKR